jgi:hypothetical protein
MQNTIWKSKEEIKYSLKNAQKVSILSCGICASLSNTGGKVGIRMLEDLLKEWGKQVTFARSIMGCCPEEAVRQALRIFGKRILKSDALVILSCSSGVKSVYLCDPGVPVVAALDTIGGVPVTRRESSMVNSLCSTCGYCVLTYSGGVCPVTMCTLGKKYAPCSAAPTNGTKCAMDPERDCAWKEIAKRGDLTALKHLSQLHEAGGERPSFTGEEKFSPSFLRKLTGWLAARGRIFVRPTSWIK